MSYTKGKFGNVSDRDVAEIYANRQAADHCAYLIPHLKPTFDILDVGCGPGSITKGLAELCPQGRTLGVDFSEELIAQNKEKVCGPGVPNLSFEVANAEDLSRFADNSLFVFPHPPLTPSRARRLSHREREREKEKERERSAAPDRYLLTRTTT